LDLKIRLKNVHIIPFNIILFIRKSLCVVKTIYNFERYGVGTRKGSTTIFSFFLKQTIIHPLPVCLWFSFTYDVERTFVVLLFHAQWHKIQSIWLTNKKNIGKCLMIGTCLMMGSSTLVSIKQLNAWLKVSEFVILLYV